MSFFLFPLDDPCWTDTNKAKYPFSLSLSPSLHLLFFSILLRNFFYLEKAAPPARSLLCILITIIQPVHPYIYISLSEILIVEMISFCHRHDYFFFFFLQPIISASSLIYWTLGEETRKKKSRSAPQKKFIPPSSLPPPPDFLCTWMSEEFHDVSLITYILPADRYVDVIKRES